MPLRMKEELQIVKEKLQTIEKEAEFARRFASTIETVLRAGSLDTVGAEMLRILLIKYRKKYPKEKDVDTVA